MWKYIQISFRPEIICYFFIDCDLCSFLYITAYVDYMDLAVCCSRKAIKLNHSLTFLYVTFDLV